MDTLPDSIKSAFPNEIDLSHDLTATDAPSGKAGKASKKVYPRIFLQDVTGLPKEGYALIYFRTVSATVGEDSDGEDTSSTDLEVHELCLPETTKGDEESNLSDAMSEMMSKRSKKSDDEDEEEENE